MFFQGDNFRFESRDLELFCGIQNRVKPDIQVNCDNKMTHEAGKDAPLAASLSSRALITLAMLAVN